MVEVVRHVVEMRGLLSFAWGMEFLKPIRTAPTYPEMGQS